MWLVNKVHVDYQDEFADMEEKTVLKYIFCREVLKTSTPLSLQQDVQLGLSQNATGLFSCFLTQLSL